MTSTKTLLVETLGATDKKVTVNEGTVDHDYTFNYSGSNSVGKENLLKGKPRKHALLKGLIGIWVIC